MYKILCVILVAFALTAASGCKNITSGVPTANNVTGEAWYVKTVTFGIAWATHIYYCPKQMGKGPAKCIEATVHEASEAPAEAAGGFGPPPPQPGYGQPAPGGYGQPAPGGYGQPAPGGYGQPAPGGYGQPAPGGYGQPPAGGGYTPSPTPTPSPGTPQPPTPGY